MHTNSDTDINHNEDTHQKKFVNVRQDLYLDSRASCLQIQTDTIDVKRSIL